MGAGLGTGDSYGGYRTRLVEQLQARGIKDLSVLRAISEVPRHLFVPASVRHRAYEDSALPLGQGQTGFAAVGPGTVTRTAAAYRVGAGPGGRGRFRVPDSADRQARLGGVRRGAGRHAGARSLVREEITTTVDLIAKDIKNSDYVNPSSSYTFVIDGKEYTWGICETKKFCKLDNTTTTSPVVLYKTSDNVEFTGLDLSYGFDNLSASGIYSKKNILITLVANHSNPVFNINNVFRQESISTRNYEL